MSAGSCQRLVDAPAEMFLVEDEVARYLRFSTDTLWRLVERGDFPEPLESSDRGRVWNWKDCVWYHLGMENRHRLKRTKGAGGGQKSANDKRDDSED